jgi:hypothetical protein
MGILRAHIIQEGAGPGALAFVGMATQGLSSMIEALMSYGQQRFSAGWSVVRQTSGSISTEAQQSPANTESFDTPVGSFGAVSSTPAPSGLPRMFAAMWWRRLVEQMRSILRAVRRTCISMCQNSIVPLVEDIARLLSPWLTICATPPVSTCLSAASLGYTACAYWSSATVNPSIGVLQVADVTAKRASKEDVQSLSTFRFIGVLMAAQASLSVLNVAVAAWSTRESTRMSDTSQASAQQPDAGTGTGPQCALCLQPRKNASTTVCGHVYCWHCIMEATMSKPECPVCRQPCLPQELMRLQNYL